MPRQCVTLKSGLEITPNVEVHNLKVSDIEHIEMRIKFKSNDLRLKEFILETLNYTPTIEANWHKEMDPFLVSRWLRDFWIKVVSEAEECEMEDLVIKERVYNKDASKKTNNSRQKRRNKGTNKGVGGNNQLADK